MGPAGTRPDRRRMQQTARPDQARRVASPRRCATLDADPARKLHGTDALQTLDAGQVRRGDRRTGRRRTSTSPNAIRALECRIAPTQQGGIYYTGPSEDFTRPGRMWWSVPEGEHRVLDLARADHRLPRGRARPSPADRARPSTARAAQPLAPPRRRGSAGTARAGRCTPSG